MPAELTVEQLAAQSGMSVRNIRAHQARGLLAPPEVRLRVGYYGPEHVARLRLIRDLQREGFNLAAIKHLLEDSDAMAQRLAQFRKTLTAPPDGEGPKTAELAERFAAHGVSRGGALAVLEQIQRHCDAVAGSLAKLFLEEVWQPLHPAGIPVERWPEIERSIDNLRPLASEALLAIFGPRLRAHLYAAFGELGRPPVE